MSEQFMDFDLVYRTERVGSRDMLVALMKTREFGELRSQSIPAVDSEDMNERLLHSLGDDLIDEYLDRCKTLGIRPVSGRLVK